MSGQRTERGDKRRAAVHYLSARERVKNGCGRCASSSPLVGEERKLRCTNPAVGGVVAHGSICDLYDRKEER